MPTYEYECMECKHRFEAFQSMKEEPIKECPKCRSSVRRLFSAGAGIIFKGSGFYVNDYKKSPSNNGKKTKGEQVNRSTSESGGPKDKSGKESGKSSPASDVKDARSA